jgi:hypothetical protein
MSLNPQATQRLNMPKVIMGPNPLPDDNKHKRNTQWIYQYGQLYGCGHVIRHYERLVQ